MVPVVDNSSTGRPGLVGVISLESSLVELPCPTLNTLSIHTRLPGISLRVQVTYHLPHLRLGLGFQSNTRVLAWVSGKWSSVPCRTHRSATGIRFCL